jgi:hypothetical protein
LRQKRADDKDHLPLNSDQRRNLHQRSFLLNSAFYEVGVATFSVLVWGVQCEVVAQQESKSVWTAAGTYVRANHTAKGRTEDSAVKRWTEWASYYRDEGYY